MSVTLKPLNQQVLFISGATSDLGILTLRSALATGAKVFMVAKYEAELQKLQNEMRQKNLSTAFAVADISESDQLQVAADHCIDTFGTIDTWINFSGVSDHSNRELFDESFWAIVNGSKVASEYLKRTGGALINVANGLSDTGLDMAFKHAVKGYTDILRKELNKQNAPLSVSFITIDEKIRLQNPSEISQRILKCSENRTKEIKVTGPTALEKFIVNLRAKNKDSREEAAVEKSEKKNVFDGVTSLFSKKKLSSAD